MANDFGQSKWYQAGTILLIIAAFVVVITGIGAKRENGSTKDGKPVGITVSGHSDIKVSPDTAYVSLGVTTREKTSRLAVEKNAKTANAVIKAIKSLNIPEKDIQTQDYSLNRWIEYTSRRTIYRGYVVHNTVRVTVRDIRKVSDVADNGVKAGANLVEGISFGVDDDEGVKRKALAAAVANAHKRAESVAKTLKAGVGKPISIEEPGGSYDYNRLYRDLPAVSGKKAKYASDYVHISPGQLEVSQDVVVTFDIE